MRQNSESSRTMFVHIIIVDAMASVSNYSQLPSHRRRQPPARRETNRSVIRPGSHPANHLKTSSLFSLFFRAGIPGNISEINDTYNAP